MPAGGDLWSSGVIPDRDSLQPMHSPLEADVWVGGKPGWPFWPVVWEAVPPYATRGLPTLDFTQTFPTELQQLLVLRLPPGAELKQ